MWDSVVLLLVLYAPPEVVPDWAPAPAWDAIRRIDVALEIAGPEEHYSNSFRYEVGYARHNLPLALTAPRVQDANLLPDYATCQRMVHDNWLYGRLLEARADAAHHRADDLRELGRLNGLCGKAWELAGSATDASSAYVTRRRALRELRELLGPVHYYAGKMPPAVPHYAFNEER